MTTWLEIVRELAQADTAAATRLLQRALASYDSRVIEQTHGIEGTPPRLYLVAPDGIRWRVYDADYRDYRPVPRPLGTATAQHRYFIAEDGTRRAYAFKKDDDHGLTVEILARHLSAAGWVARERFDPGTQQPK